MQQGTRKFFTNERSVPKQLKPTYQQVSTTDKQISHPYYAQYSIKKQLNKNTSETNLQNSKQQYFKSLNQKRKNQGQMSNLKSQLQNLKNQVNKQISKQSVLRTPQKQRIAIKQQRSDKKINYVTRGYNDQFTDKEQDFSDTASMTSVTTQKVLNQPLRRLQKKVTSQNYDQTYYMQLENDLLKTEIKNLKNKYVSKKRELTQKCQLLQKKNEYLEISLHKSEQSLIQCRKALQMEIMAIKRQITMKTQIKNDMPLPQTDKVVQNIGEGNQMLQQKLKKVYEEMSEKTKRINNLSIEIGDLETSLQRTKLQLKRQTEKSLQRLKQLQLSKRENSRLQIMIQTEMSKKKDIIKQNQSLKQKNKELMEQNYKKEQIVIGSQQYQNRINEELQMYKKREEDYERRLITMRDENKKLKQLKQTNKDQINQLKKSNQQFMSRIGVLSKKIREQSDKVYEREDYYKKIIEQIQIKQQQKINTIKQHYECLLQQKNMNNMNTKNSFNNNKIMNMTNSNKQNSNQQLNNEINNQNMFQQLRQKDRMINKWKGEYKILKLKLQQLNNIHQINTKQSHQYYQGYIQFKHKSQTLQAQNMLFNNQLQNYVKQINSYQSQMLKLKNQQKNQLYKMNNQITHLKHQILNLNQQLNLSKISIDQTQIKYQQQLKYKLQLQSKLQQFINHLTHPQSQSDQETSQFKQNQAHYEQSNQYTQSNNSQLNTDKQQHQFKQSNISSQKFNKSSKLSNRKINKSKTQSHLISQFSQSQKLQLQQLHQSILTIKKRLAQQDQKLAKNVKQLKNKDLQINKLKKQIRQLLQTHQKQLHQLKPNQTSPQSQSANNTTINIQKEIKQYSDKQIQIYKNKSTQIINQNVQLKNQIASLSDQLFSIKQQAKSLSHLYNIKSQQIQSINQKYLQQINRKQNQISQVLIHKQLRQTNFLNQISNLKHQINSLRIQIKTILTTTHKIQSHNFDQALRNQIQTSKTLRQQLAKKNQQLFKVRDNYTLLRSQYDNLRSQSQIQKLKNISQKKNIQVQYQIQIQNLKNKLNVQQKKVSSLQQKISLVIQQNKKKDSFIQSYIMGKKLPQSDKQFVTQFVKQYQIILNGKSINQKLKADSQQLQKIAAYNYRLLKDMAEMKQKMLLYETMEGQALSLYDSKHSGQVNRQNDFDSPHSSLNNSPKTPNRKFKKMNSLVQNQTGF